MLKAMIQEERRNTQDWVELVPAVRWALNTALRERYASTRFPAIFGRPPRTALSTSASSTGQDWQVDVLDDKALRKKVQGVVKVPSQLRKDVLDKVPGNRGTEREAASRGNLLNFGVGE